MSQAEPGTPQPTHHLPPEVRADLTQVFHSEVVRRGIGARRGVCPGPILIAHSFRLNLKGSEQQDLSAHPTSPASESAFAPEVPRIPVRSGDKRCSRAVVLNPENIVITGGGWGEGSGSLDKNADPTPCPQQF